MDAVLGAFESGDEGGLCLVVENDTDEGAVYAHAAGVVIDGAEVAESIEEEADAGAGGADHLGKCLLADFCDDRNRL